MANGNVRFSCDFTQAQRKIMLRALRVGREDVMREAGNVMLDHISPYVPKKSGKLRSDARVRVSPYKFSVDWGNRAPYAHYQWQGEIWGPNIYHEKAGRWFSRGPKYNTHRQIGDGSSIYDRKGNVIYTRHYTTPGTGDHWTDRFRQGSQYRSFRLWLTKHLEKVWARGN